MAKPVLFVSDIHGRQPPLESQLLTHADSKYPPELVIFLGDIVGNNLLGQLHPIFYNKIVHPVRNLLKQNPNATDDDIINCPIEKNSTLRVVDGCKELNNLLRKIDPFYNAGMSYADIARQLIGFVHFGHFCSNLSDKIIDALNQDMRNSAEAIYEIMDKFTRRYCFVVVVEGNWDARRPLDFAKGPKCIPLPPEQRKFCYREFIASKHNPQILYLDHQHTMSLGDTELIFFPFDAIINYDGSPILLDPKIKRKILIVHGHASYRAIKGNIPMGKEDQIIEEKMALIIDKVKPDKIIHGHLHQDTFHGNPGYTTSTGIPVEYLPLGTYRFIDLH